MSGRSFRRRIGLVANASLVTQPMTAAWAHYVNSNNLLNELRGLTKNYPFSSDLLDEAKVGRRAPLAASGLPTKL